MRSKRIVITGVGVVSSVGTGKSDYWKALKEGRSGIKPISLFNTDPYQVKSAAEASSFDPKTYFSKRELLTLDRATALLLVSSRSAIEDAGLTITDQNTKETGVVVGTTFGSLQSLSEFDKESVMKGPQLVNPSRFPNTVANLPASQVSIYFKIKGFNTTISTGMCAGLNAIDYAIKAIEFHNRKIVLVGVVEEMCEQTFLGFRSLSMLAGMNNGSPCVSCPFDLRRNGIVLGEGAGVLIFEDLESAQDRGAGIYAEVLSAASNFDPYRLHRYNPKATGMAEVMRLAIKKAELDPGKIDYICANANSTPEADLIECKAIAEVFGPHAEKIPVSSIKSMIGETYSAAGGMAAVAAVGVLQNNFVPPTINHELTDPRINLNLVVNKAQEMRINTIMINAFGQNGANSSVIIRRYASF